jgi:hypothetical protein
VTKINVASKTSPNARERGTQVQSEKLQEVSSHNPRQNKYTLKRKSDAMEDYTNKGSPASKKLRVSENKENNPFYSKLDHRSDDFIDADPAVKGTILASSESDESLRKKLRKPTASKALVIRSSSDISRHASEPPLPIQQAPVSWSATPEKLDNIIKASSKIYEKLSEAYHMKTETPISKTKIVPSHESGWIVEVKSNAFRR